MHKKKLSKGHIICNKVSRDPTLNVHRAFDMKFVCVAVFVAFFVVGGVNGSVSAGSGKLTLSGNGYVSLKSNIEDVWTALSSAYRYPVILSGDLIVLRSAHSSYSSYLMRCKTSYCHWYTCSGSQSMSSSLWSSCSSYTKFKITAFGKAVGQPINSGDTVSLSSYAYGSSYRLRCSTSYSTKCYMQSTTSSMTGNNWLYYNYVTFQIYSKNAVDGTPVQYGDVVGLKYPFGRYDYWLYKYSSYFYARSCSYNSKTSCAKENTMTGFRIFKKL